jgi:nucleoside-diphosphate-sugar epimerase
MSRRVFISGAAGLVGQNLIARLAESGDVDIVGVDKHSHNLAMLRELHPGLTLIHADCSERGGWEEAVRGCTDLVILHAQIGGINEQDFVRNNVDATRLLLDAAARSGVSHIVHVSSSVINSIAHDSYVETKTLQETLVRESPIPHVILRPTLMFGWFDRKHLGWLARFLKRSPVFPIPGSGRYLRQPLYAGDFCAIVASCLRSRTTGEYNISGLAKIDYVDLIKEIRGVLSVRTPILHVPYSLFWFLLRVYSMFDRDPPFTTSQLEALVTPEVFEVIDWPGLFEVTPTPLREALRQTFTEPRFAHVTLRF